MSVKVYKYINAIAFNGYSKGEMLMPDADYILKSDYDLEIRKLKRENEMLREQRNEKDVFICKMTGLGKALQKIRREELDAEIKNEMENIK